MLLYLFYHVLQPYFHALNVFRYITVRTALASLTALLITLVLGPWVIRRLRELQIGQFIREEGPKSHQSKAGTPTMGGVLIVGSTVIPTLLWGDLENEYVWLAVFTMLVFGIDRLHRRLQQGDEEEKSWVDRQAQILAADSGELRGRRRSALADGQRHVLHAAERSIFQEFSSGPGDSFASFDAISLVAFLFAVFDFCGAGHRRLFQCRESHGWSGRPGHRLRGGCRRARSRF